MAKPCEVNDEVLSRVYLSKRGAIGDVKFK